MSTVSRNLKVLKIQNSPGILLESRISESTLLLEHDSLVLLSENDAKDIKLASSKLSDAYGCLGIISRRLGGEDKTDYLTIITGCRSVGKILDTEILRITDVGFMSLTEGQFESNVFSEMKRLLCSGSFYFTLGNAPTGKFVNLTRSFHLVAKQIETKRFLWNRHLLTYFLVRGIPSAPWCVEIMCGGIDIRTIYVGAQQGQAAIISRLSCDRVGTRYNVRGVDDFGNVANFVETEQILCIGDKCTSFMMIRGSVPLHWEQPGLNVGSHKVKLPMPFDISFKAYVKHLQNLKCFYSTCTIVNLLGSKEGESLLSRVFQSHHESSDIGKDMKFINFDYHIECRVGKVTNINKLLEQLDPLLESYSFYVDDGLKFQEQSGVLRVNCLDCLDRTNSVQTFVGLKMVAKQLEVLGCSSAQLVSRFSEALKSAWQQTGDLISRLYAGTAALEGKDKVGKLKDGARSISRAIQNNLMDQGKQEAMDKLLLSNVSSSNLRHVSGDLLGHDQLYYSSQSLVEAYKQRQQFTEEYLIRVCVGSWNVNGGKLFRSIAYKDKTLKDWLIFNNEESSDKCYYQALYEYNSREDGDLNLLVGDVVLVDRELDGGEWLNGCVGNTEGIFPAAYVEKLTNPHLVLHDFPAQQDGDLQLWSNEVVDVLKSDGEWMTGRVLRDGEKFEGIFPLNFVSKMDSVATYPADIYAVGFEEMVELNAGNILNASLTNKQLWENELMKTLEGYDEYVPIISDQLVGVCLFLIVRRCLVEHITNISVSTIKTGMGGTAGNKGAVAMSMLLYNTSLCFVCSHFAAGQTQVQERNNDYNEISTNLTFAKGRKMFCHDYVFWCGDFNYRIDLTGDEVKQHVKDENWETLKKFDQLLVQKKMGNIFKDFDEGETNFAPTYKYDPFSDDYDTSEKCRTPAWTDRILWKRQPWSKILCNIEEEQFDKGMLRRYGRTELKTSDHRPVVADIDIKVFSVDDDKRSKLMEKIAGEIEPVNVPVFVFNSGSTFDKQVCTEFMYANGLEEFTACRSLRQCLVAVYPTSAKANAALGYDGSLYQDHIMRICSGEDRIRFNAATLQESPSSEIDPELSGLDGENCRMSRSHYSSDNVKGLSLPSIPRPSSTPCVRSDCVEPPLAAEKSRKPPPRPPAFSKPQKPNPISHQTENSELPASGIFASLKQNDDLTNGQAHAMSLAHLDFSVFEEPPKIKPRKTLPKRPAPRPPKAVPSGRVETVKPKPPPPPSRPLPNKATVDDPFSIFDTHTSMPPPLIPMSNANPPSEVENKDPWAAPGKNSASSVSQSFSTNFIDLLD